jgi:class 3 adenylate cyclase
MYVHPDADSAVAIAHRLIAEAEFPVRAGLSYGALIAQDGDYFGPHVNLAARLTDAASPREVLVSEALRHRLGNAREVAEQPPKPLRGIADPVVSYAVR